MFRLSLFLKKVLEGQERRMGIGCLDWKTIAKIDIGLGVRFVRVGVKVKVE